MYLIGMSLVMFARTYTYTLCASGTVNMHVFVRKFSCAIETNSFIHLLESRNAFDRVIICLDICSQWESAVMKSVRKCT